METIMSILIGFFFAIGTYMILSKSLLRIILGTSVIGHAVNLLILTMGGLKTGGPPHSRLEEHLLYGWAAAGAHSDCDCH